MKNKTKKVEIEIPVGKVAKWVDGVLTLVDEKPQDVTEHINTLVDDFIRHHRRLCYVNLNDAEFESKIARDARERGIKYERVSVARYPMYDFYYIGKKNEKENIPSLDLDFIKYIMPQLQMAQDLVEDAMKKISAAILIMKKSIF